MAVSWQEIARETPELHAIAETRLKAGTAWLATVRADGSPRLHPVTPHVGSGLHILMFPSSPKLKDLRRDPRCTLHAAVAEDDSFAVEVSLRCEAEIVENGDRPEHLDRMASGSGYSVIRLDVTRILVITQDPAGAAISRWPKL